VQSANTNLAVLNTEGSRWVGQKNIRDVFKRSRQDRAKGWRCRCVRVWWHCVSVCCQTPTGLDSCPGSVYIILSSNETDFVLTHRGVVSYPSIVVCINFCDGFSNPAGRKPEFVMTVTTNGYESNETYPSPHWIRLGFCPDWLHAFSRNFPKIRPDWQQCIGFSWYRDMGTKTVAHVSSFSQAGTHFPLHNNFCVDRSKLLVYSFSIPGQHHGASIQNYHCIPPFCCQIFSSYIFTVARSIPTVSTCSMVIDHWLGSDFITLTGLGFQIWNCCEY
jgi:hypothetical protein